MGPKGTVLWEVPIIGELSGAVLLFAGPMWVGGTVSWGPWYCSKWGMHTVHSGPTCVQTGPTRLFIGGDHKAYTVQGGPHKTVHRCVPQGCSQVGSTFSPFSFLC